MYKQVFIILVLLVLILTQKLVKRYYIPKVIHKIYIQHDNTFGTIPPEIQAAHKSWKMLNPDYDIKYYNGHDCEQYLLKYYGEEYLSIYRRINAYSGKCNFMRACIVYNEGGWYSDWKQVCLKPLDEFDLNNIRWVSAFDVPGYKKQFKEPS